MTGSRTALMAALLACIVGLLWILMPDEEVGPEPVPDGIQTVLTRPASAPEDASDSLLRNLASPSTSTLLVGRTVWDDGLPASHVRVRFGSGYVQADANGRIVVSSGSLPESGSTLPALPPCWIEEGPASVQTVSDAENGEAFRLVLPTRFPVRFSMDVDSAVLATLRSQGRDRLHVIATSLAVQLTDHPLGRLEIPLESSTLRGVLEIRSPQLAVSIRSQFGGGAKRGYDYFEKPLVVAMERQEVPAIHLSIRHENLLHVKVVDHEGNGIPGCTVRLMGPADPLPIELEWGKTSHLGDYFYLGTPGSPIAVHASCMDTTGTADITIGSKDSLAIALDLSHLTRVRVTKSGSPCQAFECSRRPWLFGGPRNRPLSTRAEGILWIDPAEAAQPLFFCWMDGGALREQRVTLPNPVNGSTAIDLDSLPPPQCSRIDFKGWDGTRRLSITIELLHPLDALPAGERQRGIFSSHEMHFLSVPWGRYELRLRDLASSRAFHSAEIEVGPGTCAIDLTDLEPPK